MNLEFNKKLISYMMENEIWQHQRRISSQKTQNQKKKIMCKIFMVSMVSIPKSTNQNIKLEEFPSQNRSNGALMLPNFIFHHIRN